MNTLDTIRKLCTERGVSIKSLEKELGYSNGSLAKAKVIPSDRVMEIAQYFGVSMEYLMTGEKKCYYTNDETASVAQEIFENKELRALFSVQRNMEPDDLRALHNMALALKRKERGYDEDA